MSGRGFPFAPDAPTLHARSRFSEIDMAASLRGEQQAPFRPSTLFAEAAYVDQYVNRRYCEHLLMAIEDRAEALGLAFTRALGAGPAQLSGEEVAALEQALVDARHLWCSVLVPACERYFNVGREVADGGGLFWLKWMLDALAERGIVLTRPDAATVATCAPQPGAAGP